MKNIGELNVKGDNKRQLKVVEDFDFNDLGHLFKFTEYLSGAKFRVKKYDDGTVKVLYTDGDSGAMEFGFSEIYEEHGYQMELIECKWCDITPEYMRKINRVFTRPDDYYDGEVIVFEEPCITVAWDSDERNERIINAKKDRENNVDCVV